MITIGTVIDGRYKVLEKIGQGGMSVVYLAMDSRLNKSLAVKEIRKRDNAKTQLLLKSLVAEANMLKDFDHAAIPKIYDIIESEGDIYVVMDYIEGENLKEKLDREGPQAAENVVNWALQIADVLQYLHTRKPNPIIYRDMKPHNLMVTPEGKIKLIDFGISKEYKDEETRDKSTAWTEEYAAPEQLAKKLTDQRSDIFSLGVTLYHLVTGKTIKDYPNKLIPIREWNPGLPEGLEYIIEKCTNEKPEDRYQSCDELYYELENINKLTKDYKMALVKQAKKFFICLSMLIVSIVVMLTGLRGINKSNFESYQAMINESSRLFIDGKDTKSIEILEQAIKEGDSKRADAYIGLLDIYINRNEADLGLAKVEGYINEGYGHLNKNNEVLFKVAMTYFDVKKNYPQALKYFQQVDEKKIPVVKYYKILANRMGSITTDYTNFGNELAEFEKFNDSLPNDEKKILNYNALAGIYLSYKSQLTDANDKTIAIAEKAREIIKNLDNENIRFKYEASFEQKIAQAYYSKGVNNEDKTAAREDFEKAITHYQNLLGIQGDKSEDFIINIGSIYQELQDYNKAISQFNDAIRKNPKSVNAYVKLINLLVDIEQSKGPSGQNYLQVRGLYQEASKIPQSQENEGYKKLTRRLKNIEVI